MTRGDLMVRDGILVTNAAWTVVALASVLSADELRAAIREALAMQLVSVRGIVALLERLGPVRGARTLRRIIARALPARSELEEVVYDLIVAGGFEPPEVNEPLRLEGRVVIPDFRWPKQKLVIEADGARWHDNALARADDAERQELLERHGETVLRIRWDEAVCRASAARQRLADAGAPLL
jgi:very-short-patch-repair endonuclease